MSAQRTPSVQVLVIGAGPVGLFGALCAARRGLEVMVLDQAWAGFGRGYATILHPRSLRLLDEVGLSDKLFAAGQRIDRISFHVDQTPVTTLQLASPALAIPQSTLEELLSSALRAEGIKPSAPMKATALEQTPRGVTVRVVRQELVRPGSPASYGEWEPIESSLVHADFVIGADGYESRVRTALGIAPATVGDTESFVLFEVPSSETDGFHMCFSNGLGSAMTPLPNGRGRWAFQTVTDLDRLPDEARYRALLSERAPFYRAGQSSIDWGTAIHFERRLARRFGSGRVWLAGDAAHVTSPFGAQSMNGGLFEVHDLARRYADCIAGKARPETLEEYGRDRSREWHKLLGVNVSFDLLPHAPPWLASHARKLVPSLPVSGSDLDQPLSSLGLVVR